MASKQTALDAVNIILSNIGQAPVVNLESGNPMVETAEVVLNEISRTVQSEGWVFNTDYEYPFTPDPATNEITIPSNVVSLDKPAISDCFVQLRNGKLYNRSDRTYEWDGVQDLDVVWLFDFEDLPEPFKNYITFKA